MSDRTKPKPNQFAACLTKVTVHDVKHVCFGKFKRLADAERAIQRKRSLYWDGATIYELLVTLDRDDLGLVEVETEVAVRNYTLGDRISATPSVAFQITSDLPSADAERRELCDDERRPGFVPLQVGRRRT